MYHFIVRKIIIRAFRDMSEGNYETALSQFSPDVHFLFEGEHAMGSELHGIKPVRQWFERVFRLFPGLRLNVKQVIVSGWPLGHHRRNAFTRRGYFTEWPAISKFSRSNCTAALGACD